MVSNTYCICMVSNTFCICMVLNTFCIGKVCIEYVSISMDDIDAIDIVPALVVTDQNNGEIQLIKFMADMWKLYLNL